MLKYRFVSQQIQASQGRYDLKALLGQQPAVFSLQHIRELLLHRHQIANIIGSVAQLLRR